MDPGYGKRSRSVGLHRLTELILHSSQQKEGPDGSECCAGGRNTLADRPSGPHADSFRGEKNPARELHPCLLRGSALSGAMTPALKASGHLLALFVCQLAIYFRANPAHQHRGRSDQLTILGGKKLQL